MAINYLPQNSYSSLMYGTRTPQQSSSSNQVSTAPRTWTALPSSTRTQSSNVQSSANASANKENGDTGSSGAYYSDFDGWSNPYSDSWTRAGLANWGLGTLKGVGIPAGVGLGFGLSLGDALSYGLSQGISPSGFFGGIGDLVAGGIGIPSNGFANTVGTVAGTLVGGPIGGFFGRAVAPFAADAVNDALNRRSYEEVRDIAEDLSDRYATGRIVGSAFAQNYDALADMEDSLGIANRALASAYDAVTYGARPGTFDANAVTALARTQLEKEGYVGWEAQALLNGALAPEAAVQEAIAIAQALDQQSYRPTTVQQAATSAANATTATSGAIEASRAAIDAALGAVNNNTSTAAAQRAAAESLANSIANGTNTGTGGSSQSSSSSGNRNNDNSAVKSNNKNDNSGWGGSNSGGSSNGSGKDTSNNGGSSSGDKSGNKNSGGTSGDKSKDGSGSSSGDRGGSNSGGSSSGGNKSKG